MGSISIFDIKGKVAVVTGGTGNLGYYISEGLSQAGAFTAVSGRDIRKCKIKMDEIARLTGNPVQVLDLDISDKNSIKKAFRELYKKTGRIDILVNNAFYGASGSLANMTEKNWQKGIDGTVNSVFRCTQEIIPYMKKRKTGSIINISSMYGMVSPDPGIYGNSGFNNPPNYGSGKAAIIQFTKYAACHLAKWNIRVNSVSPGAFPSAEVRKNKVFIKNLMKKIPLGRVGDPREIKGAILFLASEASSYVTGANIVVDGGWTAW